MPALGFDVVMINTMTTYGIKWGQYRIYYNQNGNSYKYGDLVGTIEPVNFRFTQRHKIPLRTDELQTIIAIQLFLFSYNKKDNQ